MIDQTHAPAVPAGRRSRSRRHRQDVEFLLHAGSLSEFDVAAFGFAIHELMVRVGAAPPSGRFEGPVSDQQLWAAIEAGLIWLRRLHSLLPDDDLEGPTMSQRLQEDDLGPVMQDLRTARRRAKWGGGLPLWLVAMNTLACGILIVGVPVLIVGQGGSQVHAASPAAVAHEQRIADLEAQLRAANEDSTYRQMRTVEALNELRDDIKQLQQSSDD